MLRLIQIRKELISYVADRIQAAAKLMHMTEQDHTYTQ